MTTTRKVKKDNYPSSTFITQNDSKNMNKEFENLLNHNPISKNKDSKGKNMKILIFNNFFQKQRDKLNRATSERKELKSRDKIPNKRKLNRDLANLEQIIEACNQTKKGIEEENKISKINNNIFELENLDYDLADDDNNIGDIDVKRSIDQFTRQKRAFIYGNTGKGHYLDSKGNDILKICNLISKVNPHYPFLVKKAQGKLTTQFIQL